MTAPMQARTTAFPQTAPATYPAASPTVVQQVAPTPAAAAPASPDSPGHTSGAGAHSVWAPTASASFDLDAAPSALPSSMPWAVPAAAPRTGAASSAATGALPATGVPANGFPPATPAQEELFGSRRNQRSGSDLMNWLRTPMAALVACGAVMFGVGFGSGFVVGKDHAGSAAVTGVQGGPGFLPGGGTGTGNGQGQRGFGGPLGQQGTTQQAPDGTTGTTTGTGTTGLADSQ